MIKLGKDTLEPLLEIHDTHFHTTGTLTESSETTPGVSEPKLCVPCTQPGVPAAHCAWSVSSPQSPVHGRETPTNCVIPSPISATSARDFNHI